MGKRFWIILLTVVVVLVGAFILTSRSSDTDQSAANKTDATTISSVDHVRGNPEAQITLIEYGDFQCPACGSVHPILKQLEEAYPTQLKVVFRHFPLSNIHPQAFGASRAAEAAGVQGKFYEMHDLLYERQSQWSNSNNAASIFKDYAKELGLDVSKFSDDYGANSTSTRINSDVQSGKDAAVTATPTFYLNGQKLDPNPRTFEEFKAKVEAVLNSAQG